MDVHKKTDTILGFISNFGLFFMWNIFLSTFKSELLKDSYKPTSQNYKEFMKYLLFYR